jgi:hypothetical protein
MNAAPWKSLIAGMMSAIAAHAFRQLGRLDVLLLELALRLIEDEGNLESEIVFQIGADLLVRALRVAGDPLEMRFDLRVIEDLEVVGRIDVPLEIVVADLVFSEIRNISRLCGYFV